VGRLYKAKHQIKSGGGKSSERKFFFLLLSLSASLTGSKLGIILALCVRAIHK
jgi:hypothetical protein